jgi:hypothetical protein
MEPTEMVRALLKKGWKQVPLAEAVQTSQPNISRLAAGNQVPKADFYDRLRDLAVREGVLTPSDQETLADYSMLSEPHQRAVQALIRSLKEGQSKPEQ